MIVVSQVMRRILELVRRVAASPASRILLEEETGVGKELIARMLHEESPRREAPFVTLNCAAVPDTLLESELFGHERGAFTDARGPKAGLLELCDGGSLLLDEIGCASLPVQAKLLRVLEGETFHRLGGLQRITVDTRFVAATNSDLRAAVSRGEFRMDLYYRLSVIHVTIPPLRERCEDILPLAEHFVGRYCRKHKRPERRLHADAAQALLRYSWPGNVRELRNVIERLVLLEDAQYISAAVLPREIRECWPAART